MMNGGNSNIKYDTITAIAIATFSFAEIGAAVFGIAKLRQDKVPMLEAVKMTNLVSSLISIVLTQSALLSLDNVENAVKYSGIVGLIFGGVSASIGVYMMVRVQWQTKAGEPDRQEKFEG
jgi:predicted membrane channel-forming protein YqfA (hemolysin III family)